MNVNFDLDSRGREEMANLSYEMLPKATERLVQVTYNFTNENVCRQTQLAIEEYEKLLKVVKNLELRWFCHITSLLDYQRRF